MVEAQVKNNQLCKRIREHESEHHEIQESNQKLIEEWKDMAISSNKRLGYLERGIVELERKFLKSVKDCQSAEGTKGDPRVYLRTYCDKLVGVGKDERICMKPFMRSLEGDTLSWYINQDLKKWSNWVSLAFDFMDRFRLNTKNMPDVFYIQNLKKNPIEMFREYATHWRSEAAKVRPALEEEQMNKFFVRAQDPQYYERLMMIENNKFSNIIKVGERIEEGIKSAAGYVTPIPAATLENPSQWVNPNKSYAYHSCMKGHTIDECQSLKDKIQSLIDKKIIVAKEPTPNIRNNPLPDHKGGGIHMIEIEDDYDPEGSIGLIIEGDDPKKPIITLNPIIVQIQLSEGAEVNMSMPLEFEATSSTKTPAPIEVEIMSPANTPALFEVAVLPPKAHAPFGVRIATLIPVAMSTMAPFHTKAVPWDDMAEARRKGKVRFKETVAAQGMTKTGRVYTPEHIAESSKQASNRPPLIETGPDDLWRKIHAKEYSRSTIGEIVLCLQMGPTWFDVDFYVIDAPASYNLLLGWRWIHVAGVVPSTLHQEVKFEWNHQEVIIHGNGMNPIYSLQNIPAIEGIRKLYGETYHHIERVNVVDKDKWWDNKIKSIMNWSGYEPGKGLSKNLQGISKPIKLKKHGTTFGLGYEYTWEEFNNWSLPWRSPYYLLEQPILHLEQTFQQGDISYGSDEEEALTAVKNLFLEDNDMDCHVVLEEEGEEGPSIQTTQQTDIDSEEDYIPDEILKEVENFENRPKSNLDET
ncbi:uncharacterized protein [Nicotiana sylvestris]|uniref:uncharacterized protein n=1 Tax=Nicotiana sylvestris TaxID=4096 RepID=UPI00388CE9B1